MAFQTGVGEFVSVGHDLERGTENGRLPRGALISEAGAQNRTGPPILRGELVRAVACLLCAVLRGRRGNAHDRGLSPAEGEGAEVNQKKRKAKEVHQYSDLDASNDPS